MGKNILKKKRYQKRVSIKLQKRRKIYQAWRKQRNLILIEQREKSRRHSKIKEVATYTAPRVFVLRENAEEVLNFINLLKRHRNSQIAVEIDLLMVISITNGSIGLLLSVVILLHKNKINVSGSKILNKEANRTLERSGFFNFVHGKIAAENRVSSDTIITKGRNTVNQIATSKIVMESMKTVTGDEMRNPPVQSMLIELMANSINHAFPNEHPKNQSKWVLAVSHDIIARKATFAFVDNGVGVINTLKLNFRRRFVYNFLLNNKDLLETAFKGEIGSQTGLNYRGRGLPSILRKFSLNQISELVVITNNVFLDFGKGDKYLLDNEFSGTFYYWEVSTECNYYGKSI